MALAVGGVHTAIRTDPELAEARFGHSMAEIALRQWTAARDGHQQMFTFGSLDDRCQGQDRSFRR